MKHMKGSLPHPMGKQQKKIRLIERSRYRRWEWGREDKKDDGNDNDIALAFLFSTQFHHLILETLFIF